MMQNERSLGRDQPPRPSKDPFQWSAISPFGENPFYGLLILAFLLLALGTWHTTRAVPDWTPDIRQRDLSPLLDSFKRTIAAVAVLIVTALFYALRSYRRSLYGILEVGCALVTGWFYGLPLISDAIGWLLENGSPPTLKDSLAVLTAVYIGVRGFDNMEQGARLVVERKERAEKKRIDDLVLATKVGVPVSALREVSDTRRRSSPTEGEEAIPYAACLVAAMVLVQSVAHQHSSPQLLLYFTMYAAFGFALQQGSARHRLPAALAFGVLLVLLGVGLGRLLS